MRTNLGWILVLACLAAPAAARDTWTSPYRGVRVLDRTTADPQRIHAAVVDLCAPGTSVHVTRPADRGLTTSRFAERNGAQVAVNGGFFVFDGFATLGLTIGDGIRWPDGNDDAGFGFAAFGADNRASISAPAEVVREASWWMREVVPGKPLLVEGGRVVREPCASHFCERHPRTAVGLDAAGRRLFLVTVDGRQPGIARGMDREALAALMIELGADRALNLDGGGSTTFYVAAEGGVLNAPSDGRERAVSTHLGVRVDEGATVSRCCEVTPVEGAHGRFVDVPAGHWGEAAAEALAAAGITRGCQADPPAFCPGCGVKRRDAAVMLARAMGLAERAPGRATFADVPLDSPGAGAIEALAEAGFIAGCAENPRRYCPDDLVTRGVAAVLVARTAGLPDAPAAPPTFGDVPAEAWYADAVEAAAAACVVQGCRAEPRAFCPEREVTRVQFAVMLARAFDVGGLGGCGGDPLPVPDAAVPDAAVPVDAAQDADVSDATVSDAAAPDAAVPDAAPDVDADGALPSDAGAVDASRPADAAADAGDVLVDGSIADASAPEADAGEPSGCAACDQAAAPGLPWLALLLLARPRRRRS